MEVGGVTVTISTTYEHNMAMGIIVAMVEPMGGVEPPTRRLQGDRSTN